MAAFRMISDLLTSHPRNDIEALGLIIGGFFLIMLPPGEFWGMYAGYVVLAAFVFQRWYARIQSIQDWPPKTESTADWPSG